MCSYIDNIYSVIILMIIFSLSMYIWYLFLDNCFTDHIKMNLNFKPNSIYYLIHDYRCEMVLMCVMITLHCRQ